MINAEVERYSDYLDSPDSLIYPESIYLKDRKKLLRWYGKNKYKYNLAKVDSLLSLIPGYKK